MTILESAPHAIDFVEAGQGPTVILVHSSVSGNRQWRALMATLSDRYHVIAPNLFGYGQTSPWPKVRSQTLDDQASLVQPFIDAGDGRVALIGHSVGGSVAMQAALANPGKVATLVLLEPNPFLLLQHYGRTDAYREAVALRDYVKEHGARGEWEGVAAHFADYWNGEGTWASTSPDRRAAFAGAMPPNFHEWDAVLGAETLTRKWSEITARTLVLSAAGTKRCIAEIVDLLKGERPDWRYVEVQEGGHMAPLTRPDLVNPIVREFLDKEHRYHAT